MSDLGIRPSSSKALALGSSALLGCLRRLRLGFSFLWSCRSGRLWIYQRHRHFNIGISSSICHVCLGAICPRITVILQPPTQPPTSKHKKKQESTSEIRNPRCIGLLTQVRLLAGGCFARALATAILALFLSSDPSVHWAIRV